MFKSSRPIQDQFNPGYRHYQHNQYLNYQHNPHYNQHGQQGSYALQESPALQGGQQLKSYTNL